MNYVTNDQAYGFFSKVSEDFGDINGKIPSNASSGNKMVTASDIATKADLVDGKVPAAQLPSFVDDVLEYASTSAFPATGESGKIYVALDTNKTYRWGGSDYVEISESLALGETSSTAYAGDKGKANADAISDIQDLIPSTATSSNKFATASDIPTVPTALADLTDDSTHRLVTDTEKTAWNGNTTDIATINGLIPSGASTSNKLATASDIPTVPTTDQTYDATSTNPQSGTAVASAISGKADTSDIPTALADLTDDSTHRVVTDTEKTTWSGKQNALTFDNAPTANSNNPVKSGGIKTAIDNSFSASETELRDTVGWTGKNRLPYPEGTRQVVTSNGTITDDPSMYLSDYIEIKGGLVFGVESRVGEAYARTAFYDSSKTFISRPTLTITSEHLSDTLAIPNNAKYVRICVEDGTAYFTNMMLRDASISDPTYEPPHKSVEELFDDIRAEQAVLGAKNLLVPPSASKTQEGGTWTVNADGTISVSGTPTGFSGITFGLTRVYNKKYIVSGLSESQNVKWGGATLKDSSGNTLYNIADIPNDNYELDFTSYADAYSLTIEVKRNSNNVPFSGTVYPMLRLASDPDDTYVPYAMTNRELTEEVTPVESEVTTTFTISDSINKIIKNGKLVQIDLKLSGVTASSGDTIFTIPTGFRPKVNTMVYLSRSSNGLLPITIYTNGNAQVIGALNGTNCQIHIMYFTD